MLALARPSSQIPQSQRRAELSPAPGRIDVAVHARAKTVEDVIGEIARAVGVDAWDAEGLSQRLRERDRRVTVMVDALDEAVEPKPVAPLLRGLTGGFDGPAARVLVGTRRGARGSSRAELLASLGRHVLIDLDDPTTSMSAMSWSTPAGY
jgi:hypothetical protein